MLAHSESESNSTHEKNLRKYNRCEKNGDVFFLFRPVGMKTEHSFHLQGMDRSIPKMLIEWWAAPG